MIEPYTPSNGSEAMFFIDQWCSRCARDKAMREGADFDECDDNELCEIIAASFRGEAVEWRELENGDVTCVAYVRHGDAIPDPRCAHTLDMFS